MPVKCRSLRSARNNRKSRSFKKSRNLRGVAQIGGDDQATTLAAVKQNGLALEYADEGGFEVGVWREIVKAAVKKNGLALDYAGTDLKKDREIVMAAVKSHGGALEYVSDELRSDPVVIEGAVRNYAGALRWALFDRVLADARSDVPRERPQASAPGRIHSDVTEYFSADEEDDEPYGSWVLPDYDFVVGSV